MSINQFEYLFTYESKSGPRGNMCFNNCTMLVDWGDIKKGEKLAYIQMNIGLYAGKTDQTTEYPDEVGVL